MSVGLNDLPKTKKKTVKRNETEKFKTILQKNLELKKEIVSIKSVKFT